MRELEADALIVSGSETDVCVLATVLDAVDIGYRVIVVRDAVCNSSDEGHNTNRETSIAPEVPEPRRAQLRVAGGVRDRNMTQPVLDRTGINAIVGELEAAAMPQHVEVQRHCQLGPLADGLHMPVDGIRRERGSAFRREHVAAVRVFLAQHCQHAQFIALNRMDGRLTALGPADVEGGVATELDLAPFEIAGLYSAQAMPVGQP